MFYSVEVDAGRGIMDTRLEYIYEIVSHPIKGWARCKIVAFKRYTGEYCCINTEFVRHYLNVTEFKCRFTKDKKLKINRGSFENYIATPKPDFRPCQGHEEIKVTAKTQQCPHH